jgi:phage tail-like protein
MPGESGYFYVNAGGAWPSATLSPTVQASGGVLSLKTLATSGSFLLGPFQVSDRPTSWFSVNSSLATGTALVNSHAQFYTFVGPAGPPPWYPLTSAPFSDPQWKAAPRDALNFAIPNSPDVMLYIGGLFRGDGTETPQLWELRVDYGRETYAKFLPPVYRKQAKSADFLDRFLGMQQQVLSGIEQEIEDLPLLFDPHAAPAGDPPSWLGWLSGWLTFILDEHWPEADARDNLARAFELYSKRGTIEGLREYLKMYTGVNAIIEEPAHEARIWALGDPNPLGFSTMLAPGALQGAMLGTTATVDQSHMTTGEALGAALYEDVAHRFCVGVYCSELTSPDTLARVRQVLDREKPAHTVYDLCVIEPAMRVGVQARVGIDAIVGRAGRPAAEIGLPLGTGILAAKADDCPKDILDRKELQLCPPRP